MAIDTVYINSLLNKYFTDTASDEEVRALFHLLEANRNDKEWEPSFMQVFDRVPADTNYKREEWDEMISGILLRKGTEKSRSRIRFLSPGWIRYAAAIIIVLGIGAYFFFPSGKKVQTPSPTIVNTTPTDIAPGHDGAILTLADGTQRALDSLGNGIIATQNGTRLQLQNGRLSYTPSGNQQEDVVYNTMTTPKGRQFQLTLPDGTRVWLNAASSIKYPTAFTGAMREVEITGEVYFEVAKYQVRTEARMPFQVAVNDMTVQVLGTHFNINAYPEEGTTRTTLLEGSIRISKGSASKLLTPGQQALVAQSNGINIIDHPDTEQVMAWKNGLFNFNNASLPTVMRQLERWYDIEVKYQGAVPEFNFQGKLDRGVNLSEVLEILTKMEVNFKKEGRTIMITP